MPSTQNSKQVLDALEKLGSTDRGDNVKLGHCAEALIELSDFLITTATENLDKGGNTATGQTISSMKSKDIEIDGQKMSLDIEILSTYKFLDAGMKGVKGGKSFANYSFKTIHPSKKMATALMSWIKTRSISTKYKAISKNEKKNQSIKRMNKTNPMSMAYAVATSIKKNGIKPTRFFTNAVKETIKLQKQKYASAFKLDIIESINALNKN